MAINNKGRYHSGVNPTKNRFDLLGGPKDGDTLTRAIIDTIREPLIVLDEKLCVITASRSFYKTFGGKPKTTQDRKFFELGNGQWNDPELKILLKKILPARTTIEGFQFEYTLPYPLGRRTMLINAREVRYKNGGGKILLSIFDITAERHLEAERERLLGQKDILLKEMRHRIANSLQLIASILILKAGMVQSEETRLHLEDAHSRIMTVATVQEQLDPLSLNGGVIEVKTYLAKLCESLAKSMIGNRHPISLTVHATKGNATAEEAISLGLMTTELVINAIKHAFPNGRNGSVAVTYTARGAAWTLQVADNGVGQMKNDQQPGLGTGIVAALANQMKAEIKTKSDRHGMVVSIAHAAHQGTVRRGKRSQ